jgi:hypothetical protein
VIRHHLLRLTLLLALGSLVVWTTGILSPSPQGVAQEPPPEPPPIQCDESFAAGENQGRLQPEHPLEMNSVVSDPRSSQFRDPLIKHVVMEKSLWDCVDRTGAEERRFTRDVEIFIEIVQRVPQAGRTTTVEKRVEEAVCDRTIHPDPFQTTSLAVDCSTRDVPLRQDVSIGQFSCSRQSPEFRPAPTDPVEMNTVTTARQETVKTMKVEYERLLCGFGREGGRGSLFVFTEIVEQRAGAPGADSIRPTEKKFQGILCFAPDQRSTGQPPPGHLEFLEGSRAELCVHFVP